MDRAIDIIGSGANERGKDDHFKRRDLYSPKREMEEILDTGGVPPSLGDHARHILEHTQIAMTTDWATAGPSENMRLRQHLAGHMDAWLLDGKRYSSGPRSVEDAVDYARHQAPLGPGQ